MANNLLDAVLTSTSWKVDIFASTSIPEVDWLSLSMKKIRMFQPWLTSDRQVE